MPKGKGKRHTPEQVVAILRRAESSEAVATVCREMNISAATFHRWKSQYGGMELTELQQLRGLRDENARLKRLVADQALHIQVLKEVKVKNGIDPCSRIGRNGALNDFSASGKGVFRGVATPMSSIPEPGSCTTPPALRCSD